MAFDPATSKFAIQVYGKQETKLGRKTIIYGMFGTGKTTLAASWPSPLFIDTDFGENEALVKLGIPYLSPPRSRFFLSIKDLIASWIEKRDVFDPDGGPYAQCKTLVIDTWTKLNATILEEAARENNRDLTKTKASFTDWGLLRSRQFAIMDALTQLCEYRGIDVVITAQPAVMGDEMEDAKKSETDGEGYSQVIGMPALTGGYKRAFGADVSELYYVEVVQGATPVRRIWTVPHGGYYAKTRIGLPATLSLPADKSGYEMIKAAAKI